MTARGGPTTTTTTTTTDMGDGGAPAMNIEAEGPTLECPLCAHKSSSTKNNGLWDDIRTSMLKIRSF